MVELAIPQSWSHQQLAAIAGEIMPASRPDIDNFVKSARRDHRIVFGDDAQIVELRAQKFGSRS